MTSESVTELLARWQEGDQDALSSLIPLVYEELRKIARRQLVRERSEHTLQCTALVHEAYVRLAKQKQVPARNRAHFVALAARLMRQILVDHARGHGAAKRGPKQRVQLDTGMAVAPMRTIDVVELNDALNDLARMDEQQSRIVELRFFGGLTTEETAEVLAISPATVKRDWNVAKSWLTRQMKKGYRADAGTMEAD
jgi:RNA polymerase sigma factor (TIGR02999 family)